MTDVDYYFTFPTVFRMTATDGLLLDDAVQIAVTALCARFRDCIELHTGHLVHPKWKQGDHGWNRAQLWKIFAMCFAAYFDIQRNYNYKVNFSFDPPPFTPKTHLELIRNPSDQMAYSFLLQDIKNHGKWCVIEQGVVVALGDYNLCISQIRRDCTFCLVSTEPAPVYEL